MPKTAQAVAESFRENILAAADEIDTTRSLTDDIVAGLKKAGAFRLLIPQKFGGLEAPFLDYLGAVQTYAEADASTAWCINQGAVIGTTSVWLQPEAIHEIWDDPAACVANGPPGKCVADPAGDVWRLSGRWGFSSGCRHATWMAGAARVKDSKRWVSSFFPKSQATFHDTWDVQGLRGTASYEFSVERLEIENRFVADLSGVAQHDGVYYRLPTGLVFAVSFASVALGVARAALDVVLDLAQGKFPKFGTQVLKDDPDVQKLLGEAEIRWRAGRAFLYDTVSDVLDKLGDQDAIADDQRIALRMTGTHVIREAAAALDLAYTVAGSSSIYRSNPLQRRFQDMHVITQHVQGRLQYYGLVGRYYLGHPFVPGPLT